MRIIFAGTPDFAAETLSALIASDHDICAVYTQPDRPAGRGRKVTASPVKQLALEHGLTVEQPINFKSDESKQQLASYQADLMIVVAYGLLLPQAVLDIPRLGCINIHASLLPRWRGAAPIQRAILAGDKETGVCIMQMEAGLDTGPVLASAKCSIELDDTAQTLHDKLATLGAETLLKSLTDIKTLQQHALPQDHALTNYAEKLQKSEAEIDWNQSAEHILRQINAFNPWPVAQTLWQQNVFRIWAAQLGKPNSDALPGQVINVTKHSIEVATGSGTLELLTVQVPGKKAMPISAFLNANHIEAGQQLG